MPSPSDMPSISRVEGAGSGPANRGGALAIALSNPVRTSRRSACTPLPGWSGFATRMRALRRMSVGTALRSLMRTHLEQAKRKRKRT